jgi:hypothetical protein
MEITKRRQGSLMIGTLLMMLIISSVSIAIIGRARHGAQLATDSRKGYSAYQDSDSNAEEFLNNLKKLDSLDNKIPENTDCDDSDFCVGENQCLDKSGALMTSCKIKDVYKIKSEGASQGLGRNIQMDIPDRIDNSGLAGGLSVELCSDPAGCPFSTGGNKTYNSCDAVVTFDPSGITDDEVKNQIEDFEVRIASGASATLTESDWVIAPEALEEHPLNNVDSNESFVLKNFSGNKGNTYNFAIKARNKNPFSLDSLYKLSTGAVTFPNAETPKNNFPDPSDIILNKLGCTVPQPNAEPLKVPYTCCNGTDYYQCLPGKTKIENGKGCGEVKTFTCDEAQKPTYSDWYSVDEYTQTRSGAGSHWVPEDDPTPEYNGTAVPCTDKCCFKCNTTYSTWIAASNCCSKPCGSAPYGTTCPANPANGTYINNSTCIAKCGDPTITTICTLSCNEGYRIEGTACVSNTRTFTCSTKPVTGTAWNIVSSYTQTWNGSAWTPADSTTAYNATASTTACRYQCASGYTWNGSSCAPATRTFTCSAKPATGTAWNTVSSYTQTWNGSAWTPADSATAYNTTASTIACRYNCATGYTWNGSSCVVACTKVCPVAPTCTCGYTGTCTVNTTNCTISDTRVCNVNPSCPTAPYCSYGYATTCQDYGCYTSGSYTCKPTPTCSTWWSKSIYRTAQAVYFNYTSSNTDALKVAYCTELNSGATFPGGGYLSPLNAYSVYLGTLPVGRYVCYLDPYSNGNVGTRCSTGVVRIIP